jgi:hypothetical protein
MEKDLNRIAQNKEPGFLIGKRSALESNLTPKKYYEIRKYARNSPSMQNIFTQDQDSQVNPTVIPGTPVSLKYIENFRVLAENGFNILTEFGDHIRTE